MKNTALLREPLTISSDLGMLLLVERVLHRREILGIPKIITKVV